MLEPLNQITSHSDRFGSNSELLNQYFCEHSPRIGELTFLVNIVNLTKSARVLNIPPESKLLNVLAPTWKIDQADFEVSKRMEEEGIKKLVATSQILKTTPMMRLSELLLFTTSPIESKSNSLRQPNRS